MVCVCRFVGQSEVKMGTSSQAAERLKTFLRQNSKGSMILSVPEGEYKGWIPKILYTLELEELYLPFMKLMSFPVGGTALGSLSSLVIFDSTGNNLNRLPNSFSNCRDLQKLNLTFNCLEQIPSSVFRLTQLVELDVSENDLSFIGPEIGELVNLRYLNLSGNILESIPKELTNCQRLQRLNLSGKWYPRGGLTTVPDAICQLPDLMELDLSWHKIEELPDAIGELTKLQTLNLQGNMLKHVSPEISKCTRLQTLNLTGAMKLLAVIPPGLFSLKELRHLDMSDNYFTEIPSGVSGLTKLRVFIMQRNALLRLPDELFLLKNLEELELSENYLREIPARIRKLHNLKHLSVCRNELQWLPKEICECKALTGIVLSNNKLEEIPEKMYKLSNLEELNLQCNELKSLPLLLDRLEKLTVTKRLYLQGNALKKPPQEICDQGVIGLFKFLKELRVSEASHRKKMILIGASKAGKTSLRNALLLGYSKLTAEHERTWVLERHLWEPQSDMRVQVLDFGGHHIYSAAHHMFLTPEALHIVVFDYSKFTTDSYDYQVGDWIDAVTDRAPGASVVVVGTHADLCSEEQILEANEHILKTMHREENEKLQGMRAELERLEKLLGSPEVRENYSGRFTNIEVERAKERVEHLKRMLNTRIKLPNRIYTLSCAEDLQGVEPFREDLLHKMKGSDSKELPAAWAKFLSSIQSKTDKILSWEQTMEIFKQVMSDMKQSVMGISGSMDASLATILKYLHATGEIVWYHENPKLHGIVFHRPETLVEMLRAIFRHDFKEVVKFQETFGRIVNLSQQRFDLAMEEFLMRGMMPVELLQFCLHQFRLSVDALDTFVSLMLKFDLCYEVPKTLGCTKLIWAQKVLHFPWFLSEDTPSNLETLWPGKTPPHMVELRMIVQFQHKGPPNFFEKFSVRLQKHIYDRVDWKDGIFARKNRSKMLVTREKSDEFFNVTLAVRGSDLQELWSLVLEPRRDMVAILTEWPCARVEFFSVCPHCIIAGIDPPAVFPGDVFEARCPRGVYHFQCPKDEEDSIPACFIYSLDQGTV